MRPERCAPMIPQCEQDFPSDVPRYNWPPATFCADRAKRLSGWAMSMFVLICSFEYTVPLTAKVLPPIVSEITIGIVGAVAANNRFDRGVCRVPIDALVPAPRDAAFKRSGLTNRVQATGSYQPDAVALSVRDRPPGACDDRPLSGSRTRPQCLSTVFGCWWWANGFARNNYFGLKMNLMPG